MSNAESPFGDFNPFGTGGDFGSEAVKPKKEYVFQNREEDDLLQQLAAVRPSPVIATAASVVVDKVVTAGQALMKAIFDIIKQAFSMAIFKFAIETCAMGIRTLVEMMSNMKLTPPNIDTKGVYYNTGTGTSNVSGGVQNSSTYTNQSQPRYDNPFSNPFGSASW